MTEAELKELAETVLPYVKEKYEQMMNTPVKGVTEASRVAHQEDEDKLKQDLRSLEKFVNGDTGA